MQEKKEKAKQKEIAIVETAKADKSLTKTAHGHKDSKDATKVSRKTKAAIKLENSIEKP